MKNAILIALITLLFFSFAYTNTKNDADSENIKIVKKVFKHFNNHDWEKMANMYAENAKYKDPSLGAETVTQSRSQLIKKYKEMEKMFPDIHDEVISIYPAGKNVVIVEFVSTGTAPDGSKFKLPICTIFKIDKGFIIEDSTYYDQPK